MYDLAIIGGGPAGISAAVTAVRQGLRVVLIADSLGGRLREIGQIDNWPGEERLTGSRLAAKFAKRVAALIALKSSLDYRQNRAVKIQKISQLLVVTLENEDKLTARTLILAMGAQHGTLGIPGEKKLLNKGVSYCVACDAPYYKGKKVAVFGQPEPALSMARHLTRIASRIYLLLPQQTIPAATSAGITVLPDSRVVGITGDKRVATIRYRSPGKKTEEVSVDGVFIAAKPVPNSEVVSDIVDLDNDGYIKVNHRTMSTSEPGIFAAGDITNSHFKQISTAIGDGTKASLSAIKYMTVIGTQRS